MKTESPPSELPIPFQFESIFGASLVMREIVKLIMEAAAVDIPVLITGETGTGKELVAEAIQKRSKRRDFPYVAVNTGAISHELITSELFGHERGSYTGAAVAHTGFFEQANRGTIFLDEISTMDEKSQICLLRVLETKTFRRVGGLKDIHVDVRVIAATNENLDDAVSGKRFREDLFYRLDVFRIHLPPLRHRPGAIDLLTDHFVAQFSEQFQKDIRRVSPEAYRYMRLYPWPGNVRELKNVLQRAVLNATGQEFTPDLLPGRIRDQGELKTLVDGLRLRVGMTLQSAEKELIRMTLGFTKGNKKAAGEMLGISRRALYNKLKKYGL
ncbi:MAG TPA: sigma-54 dependent transcriptional regulator [Candidatus Binatia bacterium]